MLKAPNVLQKLPIQTHRNAGFVWPTAEAGCARPSAKSVSECAVKRRRTPVGEQETHPATSAPAGSNRGGHGSNEMSEALGVKGPDRGSASEQAVMRMNIEQVPKPSDVDADPVQTWGRLAPNSTRAKITLLGSTGALVTACWQEEFCRNTGDPTQCAARRRGNRPPARAGQGWAGSRRGPSDRGSWVMPVEGRGLGSRATQEEAKARRLA